MRDDLQRLEINRFDFEHAFELLDESSDDIMQAYLDRETGEILWVYVSDEEYEETLNQPAEENRELRERIERDRKRYWLIPSPTQSDDHDMIKEFLHSNWTDDKELWEKAWDAYNGRIGEWKRSVSQDTIHAFREFESEYFHYLGERLLRAEGIEAVWK